MPRIPALVDENPLQHLPMETISMLDERVQAERSHLVQQRQTDLESVFGRHDVLVRQLFHMERFGLMLEYNPEEAKRDNSDVYHNFKAPFNLLRTAAVSGRMTRRNQANQSPPFTNTSTTSAINRERSRIGESLSITSDHVGGAIMNHSLPRKRRKTIEHGEYGKPRNQPVNKLKSRRPTPMPYSNSTPIMVSSLDATNDRPHIHAGCDSDSSSLTELDTSEPGTLIPSPTRKKRFHKPRGKTNSVLLPPSKTKIRHSSRQSSAQDPPLHRGSSPERTFKSAASQSGGGRNRSEAIRKGAGSDVAPTPRFSHIKKVHLIVKAPPPMISHPEQRQLPRSFHGRLDKFLDSYVILSDEEETLSSLKLIAHKEASLREAAWRIRKKHSRPTWITGGSDGNENGEKSPFLQLERPRRGIWDDVVDEVIKVGIRRAARSDSQIPRIPARIATLIQERTNRGIILDAAEEKRLRKLAKTVSNLMRQRWKDVLLHNRQEVMLREEEEELERGRRHLEEMIGQSDQVLATQEATLLQSRFLARSPSMDSSFLSAYSDDFSDLDRETETESASGSEAEGVTIDNDIGTEFLLDLAEPGFSDSPSGKAATSDHKIDEDLSLPDPGVKFGELPSRPSSFIDAVPDLTSSSSATSRSSPRDPFDLGDLQSIIPISTTPANESDNFNEDPYLHLGIAHAVVNHELELGYDRTAHGEVISHLEPEPLSKPKYLDCFASAPVLWNPIARIDPPVLLRGSLRPYQLSGLQWLVSLHNGNINGILADEMGLGKTIQTIALLGYLACTRGIWGPHLIIVPTSVILNWEMEFKKFLPGFKVLSYHGTSTRRKELRKGWLDKDQFNVCITSYTLATKDAHIFKRKPWYYMILDEAHMIKNFKSQRWNILLLFRTFRRLLLSGTPLQNNLTELWALLQFLQSGSDFAGQKEFAEWFSNPLEKAIEMGDTNSDEVQESVTKLHSLLRPHLLRRLKKDVEKELPKKYEHLVLCPLSKRQRLLYDEFMSRRTTRDALGSGVYLNIANVLMQLRKVCNHPDLFEVRPVTTPFVMSRSIAAGYTAVDCCVKHRSRCSHDTWTIPSLPGLYFIRQVGHSFHRDVGLRVDACDSVIPDLGPVPLHDTKTITGFQEHQAYQERSRELVRRMNIHMINRMRCSQSQVPLSLETIVAVRKLFRPIVPLADMDRHRKHLRTSSIIPSMVTSNSERAYVMAGTIERFAFATPPVVALGLPRLVFGNHADLIEALNYAEPHLFDLFHRPAVKLQIGVPERALLQYDCGKLQRLYDLLRERKAGDHRVLIFTQMTKILDILESFLNLHGYLYLRLDGSTKIEDRQYITERFNNDPRILCFISSSRSGGVGINLTGADTVIFYDSDFNPQMDRQCEDRAHRIGQIRDVHVYRFVSQYTVEEALLLKANQKRSLDNLVIQEGEFDWRTMFNDDRAGALATAMSGHEDAEDAEAACISAREYKDLLGADAVDFDQQDLITIAQLDNLSTSGDVEVAPDEAVDEEDGRTVLEYMLQYVNRDGEKEYFGEWNLN